MSEVLEEMWSQLSAAQKGQQYTRCILVHANDYPYLVSAWKKNRTKEKQKAMVNRLKKIK